MRLWENPQQVVLAWCGNTLCLNGGRRADALIGISSIHEWVKRAFLGLENVPSVHKLCSDNQGNQVLHGLGGKGSNNLKISHTSQNPYR